MVKEQITFEDYNGNKITRDFYFHLNKVELMKLETSYPGGFSTFAKAALANNDQNRMLEIITSIIESSYGKKSDDGIRFVKNHEILAEFVESEAYSELLFNLLNDPKRADRFIEKVMPSDLIDKNSKEYKQLKKEMDKLESGKEEE
ncbi:MAG: hypothetical protein HUJ78_00060 [Mogibacterium sp.]|nr:hypothetical protein [Mogibacterium sp.]